MSGIYEKIDGAVDLAFINLLDNIAVEDKFKVEFEVISMDKLVKKAERLDWVQVSCVDRNGWESDYFVNFYIPSKEAFVHISTSGYYGTGYIEKISEEEVVESLTDDDLELLDEFDLEDIFSPESLKKLGLEES